MIFALIIILWAWLCHATQPYPRHKPHQYFDWETADTVVAFGDQYSNLQGTLGHSGYSFIGDNQNIPFSADDLFADRIILNATSAGGPNWLQYLTFCGNEAGNLEPITCDVPLWDFAYKDATTMSDKDITPARADHVLSLSAQVGQFLSFAQARIEGRGATKETALVIFWSGANDIVNLIDHNLDSIDFDPLLDRIQSRFFELVAKFYATGWRNMLVMNVPPINRSPLFQANPSFSTNLILKMNEMHKKRAIQIQESVATMNILHFDANRVLNDILDYADNTGVNTTHACPYREQVAAGNITACDGYFWYDSNSPGTRAHKAFAEEMREWLFKISDVSKRRKRSLFDISRWF